MIDLYNSLLPKLLFFVFFLFLSGQLIIIPTKSHTL